MAITRKRILGKQKNYNTKEQRKCRRYGEDYSEGHNIECKANEKNCRECNKIDTCPYVVPKRLKEKTTTSTKSPRNQ